MNPFMVRQGDVLLVAVDEIPKEAKTVPRNNTRIVLAYGEVTGHAHAILDRGADLVETENLEQRFLRVLAEGGVALIHEEHSTIMLPPGNYEVIRQREYAPEAPRLVSD